MKWGNILGWANSLAIDFAMNSNSKFKYFFRSMHKMSIIPRNNILKKQLSYHLSSMHSVKLPLHSLPPAATVFSSSTQTYTKEKCIINTTLNEWMFLNFILVKELHRRQRKHDHHVRSNSAYSCSSCSSLFM